MNRPPPSTDRVLWAKHAGASNCGEPDDLQPLTPEQSRTLFALYDLLCLRNVAKDDTLSEKPTTTQNP